MLRSAMRAELPGVRNVVALSDPVTVPPRPERFLTASEFDVFLDAASDSRYHVLYATIVGLGLRVSEALGLTWADLDWDKRQVRIEFRLDQPRNGKLASRTWLKTEQSRRTLDLPDETYVVLRGLLRRQRDEQDEANQAGIPWLNDDQLAFTGQYGSPVAATSLRSGSPPECGPQACAPSASMI